LLLVLWGLHSRIHFDPADQPGVFDMKILAMISLILFGIPALAAEPVKGTSSSSSEIRMWKTGENSGYYVYGSEGTSAWEAGPFEDMPIECHGAGFWSPTEVLGEGICIFGAEPDQWTVVQQMVEGSNLWSEKTNLSDRTGDWNVVHGTGRYAGMTGSGTFTARDLENGKRITEIEGEVELE
jgi:hypothetical protein